MRAIAAALMLAGALRAQPSELATLATPVRATSFVLAKSGHLAGVVCEDGKLHVTKPLHERTGPRALATCPTQCPPLPDLRTE